MNKLLIISVIALFACSCSKDPAIQKQSVIKTVCGHPGWPQGNWNIKYEITGATVPDSLYWTVNMPDPIASYYFRRRVLPSLPIIDSTTFCGDLNSDINIFLFDRDTTNIYNCKIYVNNVLKANVTGNSKLFSGWLSAGAQCQ
jgi:hypothetical protein